LFGNDFSNKTKTTRTTSKAAKSKKNGKSGKAKDIPQTRLEAEKDGVSWYSTNRLAPHEMVTISNEKKDSDEPDAPEPLGDDDDYLAHF